MTMRSSTDSGDDRIGEAPTHMMPAQYRAAQAAAGSHARALLLKDNEAAQRLLTWLAAAHPDWLLRKQNESRISDSTLLRGELEVTISRHGSKLIDQARCGVTAFDKFSAKYKSCFEGRSAYPPTVMIMALFIRLAIETSQEKKAQAFLLRDANDRRGPPKPCKATMGNARFKELAAAHDIFGAPFPKELLDSTIVHLAKLKPQGLPDLLEDKAAWSCAFQLKLERMAARDAALSPQTLGFVRCLAIAGISGLRTIELLVSKFVRLVDLSDTTIDQSMSRVALLYCDGAKPHQAADRKPFQTLIRGAGFLGPWAWFPQFVEDLVGYPFIVRDFFRPISHKGRPGPDGARDTGGTMSASRWRDLRCAPPELVTRAFVDIAEAYPDPACESNRIAAHLTAYGSRHLLPSVGRAATGTDLAIPIELLNELGRWDPVVIQGIVDATQGGKRKGPRSAANAMPLRYAPNLTGPLSARDAVVSIVANFVTAHGQGAVPIQMGQIPSFEFLFQ